MPDLSPVIEMQIQAQLAYQEYETRGDLNALDVCIQSERLIMDMTEDDDPEKADTLTNLAASLNARYQSMGESRDLEESIVLAQLANALTPDESPDKHKHLRSLACSLFSRFEQEGRAEDLEEAIHLETRALKLLPNDHSDKPSLLNNLVGSLHKRFEHSGMPDDLNKSISLQSRAVDLTLDSDSDKPVWQMNLWTSLRVRFELTGHLAISRRPSHCTSKQSISLPMATRTNSAILMTQEFRCQHDMNVMETWMIFLDLFDSDLVLLRCRRTAIHSSHPVLTIYQTFYNDGIK